MVLCLVTLTDLQTRRAGLSASAELLVIISYPIVKFLFSPGTHMANRICASFRNSKMSDARYMASKEAN